MENGYGRYELFDKHQEITDFLKDLGLLEMQAPVVSVVGAGGKSTLIRMIADAYSEIGQDVIVTTTTNVFRPRHYVSTRREIAEFAVKSCDRRMVVGSVSSLVEGTHSKDREGQILHVGSPVTKDGIRKLQCPDEGCIRAMFESNLPVLIEADGAKGHAAKAPAEYEPVILPKTTHVIGVLSALCIGAPIAEAAHRPGLVCDLLNKTENDTITIADLDLLFHSDKGLGKDVTEGMRYLPLLRIG